MVYPWSFAQSTGRKNGKKQTYEGHSRWFRLADTHELLTAVANASGEGSLLPAVGSVPNESKFRRYVPMQPYDTASGGEHAHATGPDVPQSMTPVRSSSSPPTEQRPLVPLPAGPLTTAPPMPATQLGLPPQLPHQFNPQQPQHQHMPQYHPHVQHWAPPAMGPAQSQLPLPYGGSPFLPAQTVTGTHLYSSPATGGMYDMVPAAMAEYSPYGMSPAAAAGAVAAIEFGPGAVVVPLQLPTQLQQRQQPVGVPPPLPPQFAPQVQMPAAMTTMPNDGLVVYDNTAIYNDFVPPDMSGVRSMHDWLQMVPNDSKAALAKTWSLTAHRATDAAAKAPPQPAILPDEYELYGDPRSLTHLLPPLESGSEVARHAVVTAGHGTAQPPELALQYTNALYGERWDEPGQHQGPVGIGPVVPYSAAQISDAAGGVSNDPWLYGVYDANNLPYSIPAPAVGNVPASVNSPLTQIQVPADRLDLRGLAAQMPSGAPPVPHPYGSSGGGVIIPTGGGGMTPQAQTIVPAVPNLADMYGKWLGPTDSAHASTQAAQSATEPTPPAAAPVRQVQPTRLLYPADLMRQAIAASDGAKVRPATQPYPPPLDLRYLPSAILWEVRQAIRQIAAQEAPTAAATVTILEVGAANSAAARRQPASHGGARRAPTSLPHPHSLGITSPMTSRKVVTAKVNNTAAAAAANGGGGRGDIVMRGRVGQGPEQSWWLMGSRQPGKRRMESPLDPVFVVDLDTREVTVTYTRGGDRTEAETQTARRRHATINSSHSSGSDGGTGSGSDGSSSKYDSGYDSRTHRVSDSGRSSDDGMRTHGRGFRRLLYTMSGMRWWGRRGRRRSGDASRTGGSKSRRRHHRRRRHHAEEESEPSGRGSRASSHLVDGDGDQDDGTGGSGEEEGRRRRRRKGAVDDTGAREKLKGTHGAKKRMARGGGSGSGGDAKADAGRKGHGTMKEEEEQQRSEDDASRDSDMVATGKKKKTKKQDPGSGSDTARHDKARRRALSSDGKEKEGKKEKKKQEKVKGSDGVAGKAKDNKKKANKEEAHGDGRRTAKEVKAKSGQRRSASGDGDEVASIDGEGTDGSEAEADKEEADHVSSDSGSDGESAAGEKSRKLKKPSAKNFIKEWRRKSGVKKAGAAVNKPRTAPSGSSRWWKWALHGRRRSGAGSRKDPSTNDNQDTDDEADEEEGELEEEEQRLQGKQMDGKGRQQAKAEAAKAKAKTKVKVRVRNIWRRMLRRPSLSSPTPSADGRAGKDKSRREEEGEGTDPEDEDEEKHEEDEDEKPSGADGADGADRRPPLPHKSKAAQLARKLKFWRRGSAKLFVAGAAGVAGKSSSLQEKTGKKSTDGGKAAKKGNKGKEQQKKRRQEDEAGKQDTAVEAMAEGDITDEDQEVEHDSDGEEEEDGRTVAKAVEQSETAAKSKAKPGQKKKLAKDAAKEVKASKAASKAAKKAAKKGAKKEAKEQKAKAKRKGKAAGMPAAVTSEHTDESEAEGLPEETADQQETLAAASPTASKNKRGKWLHAMRAAAAKSTQLWSIKKDANPKPKAKSVKGDKPKMEATKGKAEESDSDDAASHAGSDDGGKATDGSGVSFPVQEPKGKHKKAAGGGLLAKVLGGRKVGGRTAVSRKGVESEDEEGDGESEQDEGDGDDEEEQQQQQVAKKTPMESSGERQNGKKDARRTGDDSSPTGQTAGAAAAGGGPAASNTTTSAPVSGTGSPPASPSAAAHVRAESPRSPKNGSGRLVTAISETQLAVMPSSSQSIPEIGAVAEEGDPPLRVSAGSDLGGGERAKKAPSKGTKKAKRNAKLVTRSSVPVLDSLPAPPHEGPKAKLMQNLYKLYVASTTGPATRAPESGSSIPRKAADSPASSSPAVAAVDSSRDGSRSPRKQKGQTGEAKQQEQQHQDEHKHQHQHPGVNSEDGGRLDESPSRSPLGSTKRSALERLKSTLARNRQRTSPGPSPNATIVRVTSARDSGGGEGERGSGGGAAQEGGSGPGSPFRSSPSSKPGMMERMMASLRGHKKIAEVQEVASFEDVAEPRGFGETGSRSGGPHSPTRNPSLPPSSKAWSAGPSSPTITASAAAAGGAAASGRPPLGGRSAQGAGAAQALGSPSRITSRLSATTRSELGAVTARPPAAAHQGEGENLMDSIRSRRPSGGGGDMKTESSRSNSNGRGVGAGHGGGASGGASGGWAQVQASGPVHSSPPSPMNRTPRSPLNRTATLVRGQEVESPSGSLRAHGHEAGEGAGQARDRGREGGGAGSAASMAAHLAELGLPPSNW